MKFPTLISCLLRIACLMLLSMPLGHASAAPAEDEQAAWAALRAGAIVLFRHANAPGIGDPPAFKLGDCSTQRNLDELGRAQARRIGERLRSEQVPVRAVWSSQWCRTLDTAELAALAPVREVPAFNSFFDGRGTESAQTASARALLLAWRARGTLVVVTHQVNISALSGMSTTSAEGVVLQRRGDDLVVVGRIRP
jgi:phosphohistidine phosphatase SixA